MFWSKGYCRDRQLDMMLPGAKEEEEGSNNKSVEEFIFSKEDSRIIMRKSISMNFDLRFRRVVTRHIEQERASSGLKSWLRLVII